MSRKFYITEKQLEDVIHHIDKIELELRELTSGLTDVILKQQIKED